MANIQIRKNYGTGTGSYYQHNNRGNNQFKSWFNRLIFNCLYDDLDNANYKQQYDNYPIYNENSHGFILKLTVDQQYSTGPKTDYHHNYRNNKQL